MADEPNKNVPPAQDKGQESRDKWKAGLGIALVGIGVAVACVACLPLAGFAVAGIWVSGGTIAAAGMGLSGAGVLVATTKAGLHVYDEEYEDAAMSVVSGLPFAGSYAAFNAQRSSMVLGKGTTGATGSSAPKSGSANAKPNSQPAKTVEFKGKTVTKDNSLFDPKAIDKQGRTNVQRMEEGLAPIGKDGKSVVLHHTDQTNNGPVMEILDSRHRTGYGELHTNTGQAPSQIDRPAFNSFRSDYWKTRSNDFK